jgi:hypothetical protein
MNCAEAELLICDYATLASAERFELERHLGECPACAELARDSAAAIEFMERAADVEPPPELITKILFDPPWTKAKRRRDGAIGWVRRWLDPVVQPRIVMGAMMTLLSFSLLSRYVPMRQVKPADLSPAAVWATIDDSAHRAWARSVKYYENLKVVYQIQTLIREWQQQQEDEQKPAAGSQSKQVQPKVDNRKLPIKGTTSGGAPDTNPPGGSR